MKQEDMAVRFNEKKLNRTDIEQRTVSRHRIAGGTRPDLRVVRVNDRLLAVKDFRYSSTIFRYIIGPILIRREYGALVKLSGAKGVPQIESKIDKCAIAMEHISHKTLGEIPEDSIGNDFYYELAKIVDEIHKRGVAHCDLRSRGNVLVGEDGKPYVVDFAACVYLGRGINPFTRWLFYQFVEADKNAVIRLKKKFSPGHLSETEKAEIAHPMPFEKQARWIGCTVRNLVRALSTERKCNNQSQATKR